MWKGMQTKTPIYDALNNYIEKNTIPFHVPGHKQGRGIPELEKYIGSKALQLDLTCMEDLDNICNPQGAINEAQRLAAEVYNADHAYFLVNGTTCGIQGMIMSVCQPGDKIIIPRNVHKSAVSGLILSGAKPIYVETEISQEYGMAMNISPDKIEQLVEMHPDTKAVFVINPSYYGIASNLKEIVKVAHKYNIPVIVDEAHGGHLYFNDSLPCSAMEAGADLTAISTHKLAGSMTQSSMLLLKEGLIDPKRVKAVLNLTQTTSPSYLLLVSLDLARKQMALEGKRLINRTLEIANYIRNEIRLISELELIDDVLKEKKGFYAFDKTKITINVSKLGLSGYEVEKKLRHEYNIQVELSDLSNIIFLISIGDDYKMANCLVNAVKNLVASNKSANIIKYTVNLPKIPELAVLPKEAFYSDTKVMKLEDAVGEISAEMIMAYPPGIPIICPGERLSQETIDYIQALKIENADLQGPEDPLINNINVLTNPLSLVDNYNSNKTVKVNEEVG